MPKLQPDITNSKEKIKADQKSSIELENINKTIAVPKPAVLVENENAPDKSNNEKSKDVTLQKEKEKEGGDSRRFLPNIDNGLFLGKTENENVIEEVIKELPTFGVKDINNVNYNILLGLMKEKFEEKRNEWNNRRVTFSTLNFLMALAFFAIQAAQIITAQLVDSQTNKIVSTVLPVVASVFVATYQLLDWNSKASKAKIASNRYSILLSEVENRLEILESKGFPTDEEVLKLWQVSSSLERKDPHTSKYFL